jgi:hypothetical protein
MSGITMVIDVRGRNREELLADPDFVYVGRRCAGWPASEWGNPFKVGMPIREAIRLIDELGKSRLIDRDVIGVFDDATLDGEAAVGLYRQLVLASPRLREGLSELSGKALGCWCGVWCPGDVEIPCHAVVLAKLADGIAGAPAR